MSETTPSVSLAVAAARMKTTPLNVLMHVKRGLLVGEEQDGVWSVTEASLEQFIAAGGRHKHPVCAAKSCSCTGSCG
jgi:hypothetical protein